MNTETHSDQTSRSLGETLRQQREKLQLSIEDVAKKLNIRPFIIQSIENNEFEHKSIPATFIKGYVKNYARLLKLPDEIWAATVANINQSQKTPAITDDLNKQPITTAATHGRWITYLTAIVLLFVVGMTALWWWENYQQSNSERDNLVQNYVSGEEKSVSVETDNDQALPATAIPISAATTSMDATDSSTAATNSSVNDSTSPATAELSAARQIQQPVASRITSDNVPVTIVPMQNAADSVPAAEDSETAGDQPTVVAKGDLVIEVTGPCWISVKDAKRKVLAQKEYKQGEVLSFSAEAPYSVIIGAPGNVKITYKGEAYPLKVDGRVAKFKLQ